MKKLLAGLKFFVGDFGPILVFYGVNHFYGLKPAIVASLVFSAAETAYRVGRKQEITALFKFSAVATLVFGGLDLYLQTPLFFKYEPALTNIFTGIFFGATLFHGKPLIQDLAEKRERMRSKTFKAMSGDRAYRCRLLTWIWAVYFFAKAGVYGWLASRYSIEQALVIRTTFGTASFYALLGFSIFLSRRFFDFIFARFGISTSR